MIRKSLIAALLALTVATATDVPAAASAQGQLVLKIGTPFHPASPWVQALERMRERVAARSNGRIRVRIFDSSKLGDGPSMVSRVRDGSLQAYAGPADDIATVVPAVGAIERPYLFTSESQALQRLHRERDFLAALLAERGLTLGAIMPRGSRSVWVISPSIPSTELVHGRSLAVRPDGAHALGVGDFAELPRDLARVREATLVEAAAVPRVGYWTSVILSNHSYATSMLVLSRRWLDGLPADTKRWLQPAVEEVSAAVADDVSRLEAQLIEGLASRGITVTRPSPVLAERLQQAFARSGETSMNALDAPGRKLHARLRGATSP